MKYKQIKYPLNRNNLRKFSIGLKFFSNFSKYSIILTSITLTIIATVISTLSYQNNYMNYNFIIFILYIFINIITIFHMCGILWFGFSLWFGFAYYLKLKFNECNDRIVKCIQLNKIKASLSLLRLSINEHAYLNKMTNLTNRFFCWMTFIIYFIGIPNIQLFICLLFSKRVYLLISFKIFVITGGICIVLLLVSMNMMSTWIISAAHKPYKILYSFISRRYSSILLRDRIKINEFIEHLCGPKIGFYCYNLFPMNSFEFFQLMSLFCLNFILLLKFL